MSAIYDIAGTSNDTFMINGKVTFLQGKVKPENYQGLDGDIYFQSGVDGDDTQNPSIYIKTNGAWKDLAGNALPSPFSTDIGKFVIADGINSYGLAELKIVDGAISTDVPAGQSGNAIYASMAGNDQFRIRVGGSTNAGWAEIATANEGTEPIYIRQYNGDFDDNPTVKNEFIVLDANGNTFLSKVPSASDSLISKQVPSIGWVNDPLKSTNVVHRTGDESITGKKSFTNDIGSNGFGNGLRFVSDNTNFPINFQCNATKDEAPSEIKYAAMDFYGTKMDSWHDRFAMIEMSYNTDKATGAYLTVYNADYDSEVSESKESERLGIFFPAGGTPFTYAPTPEASDNTTKIATTAWANNTSNNLVHKTGNETIGGTKTFSNTINGTALKAMWADIAEYYEGDDDYSIGTLVAFGGDKEVTIAKEDCNAVISEKPGIVLNRETDFEHPCLIALAGRVKVRVIGKVNKFDYLQLSEIPGVAAALPFEDDFNFSNVIARALENKESEEEGLVLCVVKFEL